MYTKEQRDVAKSLGEFYVHKHQHDYQAAIREIERIKFLDIVVTDDTITLVVARPGVLIGVKGENIQALVDWFKKHIKIREQNSIADLIIPLEEIEDDYV